MNGKRLCPMNHPANIRGERASRFLSERAMGVLWRHSSVNLVEPRSIALAGLDFLQQLPEITNAVSITAPASQPAQRLFSGGEHHKNLEIFARPAQSQFRLNDIGVIQAFGFNDLGGNA